MRISASSIEMSKKESFSKSYTQTSTSISKNVSNGNMRYTESEMSDTFTYSSVEKSHQNIGFYDSLEDARTKNNAIEKPQADKDSVSLTHTSNPQISSNKNIEDIISNRYKSSQQYFAEQLRKLILSIRERLFSKNRFIYNRNESGLSEVYSNDNSNVSIWKRVTENTFTYSEEASYSYETTGKVITADGNEIEFNLSVEMTNSFSFTGTEMYTATDVIYSDPIVISLDSNPIGVSDQKWMFDIDSDGELDAIPMLMPGSGFLVYDLDGDGLINNGNELIGGKTGNGYKELSKFDLDGNNWIDENDEIFNKLSIWIKDTSGADKLISLKAANVGAIYLGALSSNFSITNPDNNELALMRNAGMYLTESGICKSIMQLDFVKNAI